MRILIVFIFLIITVGCSKEPSLLDRCVATNSEEVNYYDKFVTFHKEHVRLRDIFISSVKPAEYYGLDIESLSVFTFNAEQNRYYWDRKWSRANHPNCKTCSDAPSWEEPWNNYLKHLSDFIYYLNETELEIKRNHGIEFSREFDDRFAWVSQDLLTEDVLKKIKLIEVKGIESMKYKAAVFCASQGIH